MRLYTQEEVDKLIQEKLIETGASNAKPFEFVAQDLRESLYQLQYVSGNSQASYYQESDSMKKLVMAALDKKKVSDFTLDDRYRAIRLYRRLSETLLEELEEYKEAEK